MSYHLASIVDNPTPQPIFYLFLLVPVLNAYLVHYPSARLLRIGLFPVGMAAAVWATVGRNEAISPVNRLRIAQALVRASSHPLESSPYPSALTNQLFWHLGSSFKHAFARNPPALPPPNSPLLARFRSFTTVKAFYLLARDWVGLDLFPGLNNHIPLTWSAYFSAVSYHLSGLVLNFVLADAFSYLPYRLAPSTLGAKRMPGGGGDFSAWCIELSKAWSVPAWTIWALWTLHLMGLTASIVASFPHMVALIGVASGLNPPSEFKPVMHSPLRSTSLNDFWGTRYHQPWFEYMATPLRRLPRPLYILSIFLISALYHIVVYYPLTFSFCFRPYLVFYTVNGLACIAEREYLKRTGRKVGAGREAKRLIAGRGAEGCEAEAGARMQIGGTGGLGGGCEAGDHADALRPRPASLSGSDARSALLLRRLGLAWETKLGGWLWTWGVLLVSGLLTAEREYSIGWAGSLRGELGDEAGLPVPWAVWALGLGPRPDQPGA